MLNSPNTCFVKELREKNIKRTRYYEKLDYLYKVGAVQYTADLV